MDVGRAMVPRLGLGLLLLAGSTRYPARGAAHGRNGRGQSDGGQAGAGGPAAGAAPAHADLLKSNNCCNTSKAPNPANATTKALGSALQSTASLLVISLSLYTSTVERLRPRNSYTSPSSKPNPNGI
ncbi:hypothetical protein TREES_T100000816 [Tupaia chinensis]|uniref:Uncharacterized protein n=1 Tax=Tupaia chinensis TaxID=246437 RepID=L9KFA8_TUPCH|nr:hypothetical protein TREES_T100000816 [Tupaia chinensis]